MIYVYVILWCLIQVHFRPYTLFYNIYNSIPHAQ